MTDDVRPVWVLGGGGVAGIAWEVGILTGLADEGVTVAPDAVLIGTSSGAVVGAQLSSGTPSRNSSSASAAVSPTKPHPHRASSTCFGSRGHNCSRATPSRPLAASVDLPSPHASTTRPGSGG